MKHPNKYISEEGEVLFGKHKGKQLFEVHEEDPTYILWMYQELDLNTDEASSCEDYLDED